MVVVPLLKSLGVMLNEPSILYEVNIIIYIYILEGYYMIDTVKLYLCVFVMRKYALINKHTN